VVLLVLCLHAPSLTSPSERAFTPVFDGLCGEGTLWRQPLYNPSSRFALPPAIAAMVDASKPSTPATWPIGSQSAMLNG
jgi:hypothetical protein